MDFGRKDVSYFGKHVGLGRNEKTHQEGTHIYFHFIFFFFFNLFFCPKPLSEAIIIIDLMQ